MRQFKLTRSKTALVDSEDFERINRYIWHAVKGRHTFYAQTNTKQGMLLMHRAILSIPSDIGIDHKDGNGCNNQKENLRICTRSQNLANMKSHTGASKYKGVSWDKHNIKWIVQIQIDNQPYFLGRFKVEDDAALAYNVAAIKYFGDFARLNTIKKSLDQKLYLEKLKQLGI